jgi:predicted CXXCH cytochrome family protein
MTNGLPFVKCCVKLCWLIFVWLIAAHSWAVDVSGQRVLAANLQQPVAVALSAEKRIFLDAAGLHFDQTLLENENAALSLFADKNDIWTANPIKRELSRFDHSGKRLQTIDVSQTAESKNSPEPVAVAIYEKTVYWADRANHRVCRFDLAKNAALPCFGERGEMDGQFQYPYQLAFDRDGYLHVVDILNSRIQQFDKNGRFFATIGKFGTDTTSLFRPNGIAIDTKNDLLFVSDSYFGTIKVFKNGESLGELTGKNDETLRLKSPTSLVFQNEKLVVAETLGNQIVEFSINPTFLPAGKNNGEPIESSQKNCLACHLSWVTQTAQPDKQGALPDSSFAMCYSCHNGAIVDSRLRIGAGKQHASIYDDEKLKKKRFVEKRADKLPNDFPHGEHHELTCSSCHTPHTKLASDKSPPAPLSKGGEVLSNETLYKEHGNAWLRVPNKNGDLCEKCHESKGKNAREKDAKKRGLNHPLAIKLAVPPEKNAPSFATEAKLQQHGLPEKIKQQGGVLGHENEMICQTCHQIHGGFENDSLTVIENDKATLCVTCHERQTSENEKDAHKKGVHPVNIKPDEKKHPKPMRKDDKAVEFVTCQTCHAVHDGKLDSALLEKKYQTTGALCETCHDKQASKNKEDARRKGIHPTNIEPDEPMKQNDKLVKWITCQSCHNVHSGNPDTALLDKGIKDAESLCKTCHQRQHANDKDAAHAKGVHPVNVKMDEAVEIVAGKKTKEIRCLTCHAVHEGKPDTPALVENDKDGELCSHCHQGKQAIVGSDHDLRITAKNKLNRFDEKPQQSGVCGACHSLHKASSNPPHLFSTKAVVEDFADHELQHSELHEDQLCINCHQKNGIAEKKIVKFFNHPHKDMVLRSDKKIMPLLNNKEESDELGQIACKTCHEPHFWSAKMAKKALESKPKSILSQGQTDNVEGTPLNSFLRTEGVKGTFCVDCHGMNALPKFKYFHDKNTVRQIGVDYLQ